MASPNHLSPSDAMHPPTGTEQHVDDPFSFLDPDYVQQMRYAQYQFVKQEKSKAAPNDIQGRLTGEQTALDNLDIVRKHFLEDRGVDTTDPNNPQFQQYMDWMRKVSIDNMNEVEWRSGTIDANGNHVPSGRDMLYEFHDAKVDEYVDENLKEFGGLNGAVSIADRLVADARAQRGAVQQRIDSLTTKQSTQSPDTTGPVSIPQHTPNAPDQTGPILPTQKEPPVKGALIDQIWANIQRNTPEAVERDREIDRLDKRLDIAREELATAAAGIRGTRSREYHKARSRWEMYMARYGELCEEREKAGNPRRTRADFSLDATVYAVDQISRLDDLVAEKKSNTLRGKFINAFKNNKLTQMLMAGAVAGGTALAAGEAPTTVAVKTLMGAGIAPKLIEGVDALVGNPYPHTEYDPNTLKDIFDTSHASDMYTMFQASRFLGEHFNTSERKRRKKAGVKAVLGGAATVFTLAGMSYAMDATHDFSGTETIEGKPAAQEGSASATKPDHSPFDFDLNIDNSGDKGQQPENPNPPQTEQPSQPEKPPIFITPEALLQGINVPLEWGDGALAVGERMGLDSDQQQRFVELLSQRHDGSTYTAPDGVRLYFNGGGLHLSPEDLLRIYRG